MTEVALVDVSARLWHYHNFTRDELLSLHEFHSICQCQTNQELVEAIVRYELGDEIVDKYKEMVKKWDEFERLANEEIHK